MVAGYRFDAQECRMEAVSCNGYKLQLQHTGIWNKKTVSRLSVCCLFIYNVTGVIASK